MGSEIDCLLSGVNVLRSLHMPIDIGCRPTLGSKVVNCTVRLYFFVYQVPSSGEQAYTRLSIYPNPPYIPVKIFPLMC